MSALLSRQATHPKSAAVPGFESIQRFWDPGNVCWTAKILPGEFYVTTEAEAVTTVLGSCISACIRDPVLGCGGMNHFMLPEETAGGTGSWSTANGGASNRYGSYAMESLVNALLKLGARRERFEVKLFGGGRILPAMSDVGHRNIEFAKDYLRLEGFRLAAHDMGEVYPRRVVYFPATGRVLVKHMRAVDCGAIATRESQYRVNLGAAPGNDVELFG